MDLTKQIRLRQKNLLALWINNGIANEDSTETGERAFVSQERPGINFAVVNERF